MSEPYTQEDLMHIALGSLKVDPLRVIATYAAEDNWEGVYDDRRKRWAWVGPMIPGFELAQLALQDVATEKGKQ